MTPNAARHPPDTVATSASAAHTTDVSRCTRFSSGSGSVAIIGTARSGHASDSTEHDQRTGAAPYEEEHEREPWRGREPAIEPTANPESDCDRDDECEPDGADGA